MGSEKKPQPVKRYKTDFVQMPFGEIRVVMDDAHDGEWVRYSDHEATIEALRTERVDKADAWDANAASIGKWKSRAETAEARVAQLEAALEPFAKLFNLALDEPQEIIPDSTSVFTSKTGRSVTYGDFRRARALLSDGGR